jgi:hypothetical protein
MKPRALLALLTFTAALSFASAADNALTAAEKAAGWQLLFDGQSFAGLRGYREKAAPSAGWEIRDGMLCTVAKVKGKELITDQKFNDFELAWEWRIAEGGNNGLKYFVTEDRPHAPGHEYQMIDDARNSDAKIGPHRQTASFYDVLPPAADKPSKPAGEWNASRIIVRGNHVEHWLNGQRVLAYELGSPEVKAGLAKSKFAKEPGFGEKISGHIMFTYHNDACCYRNIKLRELK